MATKKKTAKKNTIAQRSSLDYKPEKATKKTAKKPAKKTAKAAPPTGEGKAAGSRPPARPGGVSRPKSEQVKHGNRVVIPAGLGVEAAWCSAFVANETHHQTDAVICGWMQAAFPGRDSEVLKKVASVRGKYNRGGFPKITGNPPEVPSQRYDADGDVAMNYGHKLKK